MPEWSKVIWQRTKALLNRRRLDRDLDDELSFHLAMREAKNQREGAAPEEVSPAARKQFGNVTRLKESCRELWTFVWLESLFQDLRYGARLLRKNPGFTTVAVVTLALGIGANTAIFSLTYQVLLQRLPVPHPEELVVLHSAGYQPGHVSSDSEGSEASFSYPAYKELRAQNTVFAGLLARYSVALSVAGPGFSERAGGELVSGNYFETLGVHSALGRVLTAEDETTAGADTVVVLSYGYWTRRFGNNPGILNKQLTVNGVALTVVGVAQEGFTGVQIGEIPDLFIPVTMQAQMTPGWNGLDSHKDYWLKLLGRLKPGVKLKSAESAVQGVYQAILEAELPLLKIQKKNEPLYLQKKLQLISGSHGRPVLQQDTQQPLLFLMAMVALVLIIACANLAGLLLAKGEARQREIAVRLSLGAGRGRLLRQLLTESLLLALTGGLLGILIGWLTLSTIVHAIPPGVGAVGLHSWLDWRVLGFAAAVSMATGLFFGLTPALRITRVVPDAELMDRNPGLAGAGNLRLRKWLMAFQVAVTVVLLVGAGLFTMSLVRLNQANLGMQTDHVIQFSIAPGLSRYSPGQTSLLAVQIRARLTALPGVRSVSAAEIPVLADSDVGGNITVEGYVAQENEDTNTDENWIGPNYFSTMGIGLLRGREFTEADSASSPKVAVVNQTVARRFFSGREAIGGHFTFGGGNVKPDIEIIGIVADSKHTNVREKPGGFVYLPYSQHKDLSELTFYVRTQQDADALAPMITRLVAEFDAALPVYDLKLLTQQVKDSEFTDRLLATLSAFLGMLAALLAAIGLYGVMAYVAARRTKEIGIRIALGATRGNISWLILREVVQMVGAGLAIGLTLSFFGGRLVRSLLFGISASSPWVLGLTVGLLLAVALLAGGLPARKAASVDPVITLRYE